MAGQGEEGTRSHHESCQSVDLEGKCRAVSVSWAAGPLTCQVVAGQGEEGTRSHHESCQSVDLEGKCKAVSVL